MSLIWILLIALLISRLTFELYLEHLNNQYIKNNCQKNSEPPNENQEKNLKSMEYTLSKSYLSQISTVYNAVLLILVLWAGVLPWIYQQCTAILGPTIWASAAFIFITGFIFETLHLPIDWYYQFRLEERFGFNTTTQLLWWSDLLKGLLLGLVLIYPLLALIFFFIQWSSQLWWLWAWLALISFQFILMVIGPALILPLFNKFTPLPEGNLRNLIEQVAKKSGIAFRSIKVMDGSKRSKHSNAFFTGIGKFKTIALFDTLLDHLEDKEIQSVVAHEIGHLKKKHITKQFILSGVVLLAGFYCAHLLIQQPWLVTPFGFTPGHTAPGLVMIIIFGSLILFWVSPLGNFLSRKYEYEADQFAQDQIGQTQPLINALYKLYEKNLSHLTPHPIYSMFHYSHPTLKEREKTLLNN